MNSSYRITAATAASATGNNQAQSPTYVTAVAATTHPPKKPVRRRREAFNRAISLAVDGWLRDMVFSADRTAFVKLPGHDSRLRRDRHGQPQQRELTRHGGDGHHRRDVRHHAVRSGGRLDTVEAVKPLAFSAHISNEICSENAPNSTISCALRRRRPQGPFSCNGVSPAHDDCSENASDSTIGCGTSDS